MTDEDRDEPAGATAAMEVVATVSHELRSPLTSIKGYTGLLLNRWDQLDDDQKRMMLEQVQHDADRVTRLITELLDISRLEAGTLALHPQRVAVGEVAARVVEQVAMACPDLRAEVAVPADLPVVLADPDKVQQILTNLVENAAKYADPAQVRVTAEAEGGLLAIEVHDRGEGIGPEDLPKVFDRFFRRDAGRPTGTGLGLWISRRLAEAHGGSLTATSVPGEGSTFRLVLPLGGAPPAL
jgi:signal transduction histidine kinase